MTPVISLPGVAKLASLIGDAVKHVASKVNFANAFRQVGQVGAQAPGAPRLLRLSSHDEGRLVSTMQSGVDPLLEDRRNSLDCREREVTERRSSRQGTPVSGRSISDCRAEMVVQKATILAKDYLTSHKTLGTTSLPTTVAGLRATEAAHIRFGIPRVPTADAHALGTRSWLHDHYVQRWNASSDVSPAESASATSARGSSSGKWATSVEAFRRTFVSSPDTPIEKSHLLSNAGSRRGSRSEWSQASTRSTLLSSVGSDSVFDDVGTVAASAMEQQAWQPGVAPSQGKDVQRHTAKALLDLQDELANTAILFNGTVRGNVARHIGAAVARVRNECGPDEALRIASLGIPAVRSASLKLVEPPPTHRLI